MYDIWIPSNRPELAEETRKSILPYEAKIFDGSGYDSFSKLINHCIINSTNEIVIILSDKARGNASDIEKILKLLDEGYAWVGLWIFSFIGFKKDLIRKIGWMDERFIGGGYEDSDFIKRMKEQDIAFYYTKEIPLIKLTTTWKYCKNNSWDLDFESPARKHYLNKWGEVSKISFTRLLEEEVYPYDIGECQGSNFLDFSKTVYWKEYDQSFLTMTMNKIDK